MYASFTSHASTGQDFCTSATVVTFLCIDHQLVVLKGDGIFSAGLFADTTVDTCILFPADLSCSLDPYIILLCFQTVVLASGNTEFEFMRKLSSKYLSLISPQCHSC